MNSEQHSFLSFSSEDKDERFMRMAISQAIEAQNEGEVPVGAVIVYGEKVLAQAHNLTERLSDVTAHAEILAITSASSKIGGKYLVGCTLYVTVEPCAMCATALGLSQISRVVYGASDVKRGYSRFAPFVLHPKCEVRKGVLKEECERRIKAFFKERRMDSKKL